MEEYIKYRLLSKGQRIVLTFLYKSRWKLNLKYYAQF